MPMHVDEVSVGALRMRLGVAGPADGDPVVLLHGFPQSHRVWRLVAPELVAAGHRVIAPDQRGYSPGAAPDEVAAYRMPALVGDVVGLLDALDLPAAHVVGHDWGGAVAWQVAARHPDRVRTVSVVQTPHPIALGRALQHDRGAQARFAYAALLRLPGSHRVLGAGGGWVLRRWMAAAGLPADGDVVTDPEVLRTACHWYRAFSGRALAGLPDVVVPSLLLYGRRDPVFAVAAARDSARWCSADHRHVELDDGGHWLPETHPDHVAAEVLDRIRTAAA